MKRTWKPLDLMGLRLYEVRISWPALTEVRGVDLSAGPFVLKGHKESRMVFASAPRHAAEIVSQSYRDLPADRRPYVKGRAVAVCQPAEWLESMPMVMPSECKHNRSDLIQSSEGMGKYEAVWVCLDCGTIKVHVRANGQSSSIDFGLNCDQHILAAARYMRGFQERNQAVDRCRIPGLPVPLTDLDKKSESMYALSAGGEGRGEVGTVYSPTGDANRPRLVAIAGLPGSGKSTLLNEMGAHGYQTWDDVRISLDKNISSAIETLSSGGKVAMADIEFCDPEVRSHLTESFKLYTEISWIMFENDPWTCAKNCLYRLMYEQDPRNLNVVIGTIQRLTKVYQPVKPIEKVVDAFKDVADVFTGATVPVAAAGVSTAIQGLRTTSCDCESFRCLGVALQESVKLQSHYADLLNMCDGGARIGFRDADDWITRLIETGTLRRCKLCGQLTADWVDPDWAGGRICRPCEARFANS